MIALPVVQHEIIERSVQYSFIYVLSYIHSYIVTGKYETCVAPSLGKERTYVTRGNDLRLKKFHVKYDLRKYSFFCQSGQYVE